jgi:sarcosine oxidase, subunit beta
LQALKKNARVAIIGAGIIGASIAYHLAQKGESNVIVLDMGQAGSGSTSAALGGFRHQFSSELSVKMSLESISFLEKFKELTGYDPLIRKDGYSFLAENENSLRQLRRNVELQKNLGVKVYLMSREDLQKLCPFYDFEKILGGTLCTEDGHASTFAVLQGFVSLAKDSGVEFREKTRVTGIEARKKGFTVATLDSRLDCDQLVIAAGAYSGQVGKLVGANIPVFPVPRRVLVTNSFTELPPEFPILINIDSTLAIGREGRGIVIGDNLESKPGFEMQFSQDYDEQLLEKAVERIPVLGRASIAYANQGLYEVTPDSNPIISPIPDLAGLFCCAGFSGHGFMHSPAAGKIMAEMVLGEKSHLDVSSRDVQRFANRHDERERLII